MLILYSYFLGNFLNVYVREIESTFQIWSWSTENHEVPSVYIHDSLIQKMKIG